MATVKQNLEAFEARLRTMQSQLDVFESHLESIGGDLENAVKAIDRVESLVTQAELRSVDITPEQLRDCLNGRRVQWSEFAINPSGIESVRTV